MPPFFLRSRPFRARNTRRISRASRGAAGLIKTGSTASGAPSTELPLFFCHLLQIRHAERGPFIPQKAHRAGQGSFSLHCVGRQRYGSAQVVHHLIHRQAGPRILPAFNKRLPYIGRNRDLAFGSKGHLHAVNCWPEKSGTQVRPDGFCTCAVSGQVAQPWTVAVFPKKRSAATRWG